mmetsp:Transcript_14999/g.21856  ORF Transcript_14999/g.21856 Transcript_14999/m.21856 type:complete len:742 (-) Transcript_14999:123-2348(-)
MKNLCAYTAWASWDANVRELQRQQHVLEKMALRMANMLVYKGWSTWVENATETRRHKNVLEKMVLRMMNASIFTAIRTWQENVGDIHRKRDVMLKLVVRMQNMLASRCMQRWIEVTADEVRKAAVLQRIVRRWINMTLGTTFCTWMDSVSEGKRLRRMASRVVQQWSAATIARAWSSWVDMTDEAARLQESSTSTAKEEETQLHVNELVSQIDVLGVDLSLSKGRENQLSKKLAASWKEVSNIGRECEALRLGGENQEIAMVGAQKLLQECLAVLRARELSEHMLEGQLADMQTSAFEVSTQLVMSDREVLRARKDLSRARAGEARVVQEAEDQTDKIAKKEADLKGQLQYYCTAISADLKITHQISQEFAVAVREEARAPPSLARDVPKLTMRLAMEGIKLAAKDGAYFGLGNLWGEMDSSDPYLVFRNMKGDVVHKTEVVVKNLNPKFASFEISIDKLCGSNPHFAEAEFVIECWDYDSLSSDDLIGKLTVSLKDIVTGKTLQLENSAHDNSNPPKGTNMLRVRQVQKSGFMQKLGPSADAVMQGLERELEEERESRLKIQERIQQVMAQSLEQQQALHAAHQSKTLLQEEGDMRARRAQIALKGKEAELNSALLAKSLAESKLHESELALRRLELQHPSAIFSPSPSPPPREWIVVPQTDNDAEDSWTSNRSSVNDLKEAHLVRELTPLVESLAKGESKEPSPPLSKIPATIMSEDEGLQHDNDLAPDSFQAFEGTLV